MFQTFHAVQRQGDNANPFSLLSAYFLLMIVVIISELTCSDSYYFPRKEFSLHPHCWQTPAFSCNTFILRVLCLYGEKIVFLDNGIFRNRTALALQTIVQNTK
jgi:hypothetical protein